MTDTLLTPASSPLQRDIEATIRPEINGIPVPVDTLWNPWSCPAELLPWLAFQVNVVHWNSSWPEATKRQVIASSFARHQKLGTVPAVVGGLADIGIAAELVEWHQTVPAGERGTFDVTARVNDSTVTFSAENQFDALRMIGATKRASQHLIAFALRSDMPQPLGIGKGAVGRVNLTANALVNGRGLTVPARMAVAGRPALTTETRGRATGRTRLNLPQTGAVGVALGVHVDLTERAIDSLLLTQI